MKKILDFLNKYGVLIVVCLMMLFCVQQCATKSAVKREAKYVKVLVQQNEQKDSILDRKLYSLEHKLDSTLISNAAVVSANQNTSNAIINNQKKQQIVVKVEQQKVKE